tara:strand:+ start:2279 stop:2959 length:681 start_codon:yes stop_codon:yes gene_type:complete
MKIFIDSADTDAISRCFKTGLVDGVTTNPSLILKSGRDPEDVYADLARMGVKDISMEVVGTGEEMVAEGKRLAQKFGEVATIKVPCTRGGLAACRILSKEGIRVNVTLIFNAAQAILSAKAGATYVSPFVGRLDDNSIAGLEVVRSIVDVYRAQGHFETQVLAASIREVNRAVRCWYNGASICTIPVKVFDDMYKHVLTDKGLDIFDRDWKAAHPTSQINDLGSLD